LRLALAKGSAKSDHKSCQKAETIIIFAKYALKQGIVQENFQGSEGMERVVKNRWWIGGLFLLLLCLSSLAFTYFFLDLNDSSTDADTQREETGPTVDSEPKASQSILRTATSQPPPAAEAVSAEPTPTLVSISGGRSAGDSYIPDIGNTGYDVEQYVLQLTVDPERQFLEGTAVIDARSTLNGLGAISLDFVGFSISSVTIGGAPIEYLREAKKLIIQLPSTLPEGQRFSISIAYSGSSVKEPSSFVPFVEYLGLQFPDGESIYTLAEPDGARYWYPANDHPRDKARFRFEVSVPSGLTAVANGTLIETKHTTLASGQAGQLFVWEQDEPMAPYLALLAVGEYERLEGQTPDGVPLRHYVFPELKEPFLEATGDVGEALDWMSQLLGPYPFDAFGYVTARIAGTSMESQTMVLLSETMMGPRTAVHELAHMWFGDWVSLDTWAEMWRNEGLATYFQLMWTYREDPDGLSQVMDNIASAVEENEREYQLNNPPAQFLFEFNVYQKGALAAHALRQEMGDASFFEGLRLYFERYGGGTASDAQFEEVMESAASRSLDEYFDQWFSPP
jgi:aminopeptidase N